MLCLPKYFDGNGRGFMMASIKDDLTAFKSIKEKTRPRYKKTWVEFKDFIGAGEEFDSRSPTEEELSSYLRHLRQEKGAASSSMWTLYSMINGVFKEKYGFSLKQYPRLTTLLKSFDTDTKKKAQIFTKEEIDIFVFSPELTTPYWQVRKVRNVFL